MEKSGSIVLTEEDLLLFRRGELSDRLRQDWGFNTVQELQQAISMGEVVIGFPREPV